MLLTVRQASARLGVSYSTLKQWIFKGSVRTTRTAGGHHRIAETEVDRLLAREGKLPRSVRSPPAGRRRAGVDQRPQSAQGRGHRGADGGAAGAGQAARRRSDLDGRHHPGCRDRPRPAARQSGHGDHQVDRSHDCTGSRSGTSTAAEEVLGLSQDFRFRCGTVRRERAAEATFFARWIDRRFRVRVWCRSRRGGRRAQPPLSD